MNIVIGDSQAPLIKKNSTTLSLLGNAGEKSLWKGGQNLKWLLNATKKHPVNFNVKNVVISIGTNGGFNKTDNVNGLINELKKKFPIAKFYAVKGSFGWGNNININEIDVNNYYLLFSNEGVKVLKNGIGKTENPHNNLPIYKKIGAEIDQEINNIQKGNFNFLVLIFLSLILINKIK